MTAEKLKLDKNYNITTYKDAFQSYYNLFQVNWLVQIQWYLYKSKELPRTYVNYKIIVESITRCVIKRWNNGSVIKTVKGADY